MSTTSSWRIRSEIPPSIRRLCHQCAAELIRLKSALISNGSSPRSDRHVSRATPRSADGAVKGLPVELTGVVVFGSNGARLLRAAACRSPRHKTPARATRRRQAQAPRQAPPAPASPTCPAAPCSLKFCSAIDRSLLLTRSTTSANSMRGRHASSGRMSPGRTDWYLLRRFVRIRVSACCFRDRSHRRRPPAPAASSAPRPARLRVRAGSAASAAAMPTAVRSDLRLSAARLARDPAVRRWTSRISSARTMKPTPKPDRCLQPPVAVGQPDVQGADQETDAAQAGHAGQQIDDGRPARPPDGHDRFA